MLLNFVFIIINLKLITAVVQDVDGDIPQRQNLRANDESQELQEEALKIQVYYECLCGGSREFVTKDLKPTIAKLAKYLDVQIYPYGNAKTTDKGNGQYEFECQHGENECYGNKLHACAIVILNNMTQAVLFDSCMMESGRSEHGSNDEAADACGERLNIDPEPIKKCAMGPIGTILHKYYGDESEKIDFKYVPYVLINGKEYNGDDFMADVCASFAAPPPECKK